MFNVPDSLYRLENITLIVWDVMSLQKLQIFALKRLSAMMRGLTTNISDDAIPLAAINMPRLGRFERCLRRG
jgi:hypothetical protein